MSEYFTHDIQLQAGTKARAEDINSRFDSVVAGFGKLPAPHPTEKGFSDPVPVGTPTSLIHAISVAQILSGGVTYAEDAGEVNAFVVNLPVAPVSYAEPLRITFKARYDITGTATINVNGLGVKQFTRSDGTPLVAGDIKAGQIVTGIYTGTLFRGVSAFPGQLEEVTDLAQALADLTALDRIATSADRVATGQDSTATGLDRIATGEDRAAVEASKVAHFVSSRSTTGTWNISTLALGVPLFLVTSSTITFTVTAGTAEAGSSATFVIGNNGPPGTVLIPTLNQITLEVTAVGGTTRAYHGYQWSPL